MSENKEKETIGSWASESPETKGNNKNKLSIERAIFKNINLDQYQAFLQRLKAKPAHAEMLKELSKKIALKKAQISLDGVSAPVVNPQHSSFAAQGALMHENFLDWQFTADLANFFHSLPELIQAQRAKAEANPVSAPGAAKQLVEAETKSAFQEQFEQFVDYVLDLFSLRFPRFYQLGSAVLLAIILAACSAGLPASRPVNPEQAPSPAASGETNNLPDSLTEAAATAAPLPEITQTVSAEELQQLNQDIGEKLEAAVEQADPAIQAQYSDPQRNENIASLFAQSLTDPENPADRVLDPRAFQVGLTPDGIAFLLLTADSPWGKAGEVAIIDTGADKGMFVTVTGSGVAEGKLDLNQAGYYAAVKNPLGEVKAVVDASRQWVHDLSLAEKLSSSSAWGRVVEAYLAGKIAYPAGLNAEQKIAFEKELVAAEVKLPLAEQKKLIEGRFDRSKSGVYEAVIKAGNLEYFDGSWKTLEAMKNKNGENIPWGESYDVVSEEGRAGMLKDLFGGEEAWMAQMEEYVAKDKVTGERWAKEQNYSVDTSKFNQRYIAFYRQPESLKYHTGSYPYYTLDGLTVLKNPLTKQLLVSKITTFFNGLITIHEGPYTTGFSSYDVKSRNFFDKKKMFLAINTKERLTNFYYGGDPFRERLKQEENLPAFETMWASHLEDFEQILREEPNKIQERLYQITDLLFTDSE